MVHSGVDPLFLDHAPAEPPAAVRRAGPGPHVGLCGVLEPRKARHVLLRAAELLSGRFPDARYWLVGPAALKNKRDYAERLRRAAEAPALRGRVALVGFQAEVAPWLAAMDVVVQTSVAFKSLGMPEVVHHGQTGLVVPPDDPRALAAALERLLGDRSLRAALGERGRADVRDRFAPEVFRRGVAAAYAMALEGA